MLFCPYIRDAWWGSMVSFHLSEGAMYPEWNHRVCVSVTSLLPSQVKLVSFGSRIRKLLLVFL